MRWLQIVGSIKLQVSFAKEPDKRDAILQKKPIILSILLTVASPYVQCIATCLLKSLTGSRQQWVLRRAQIDNLKNQLAINFFLYN